jgi:hypothetical protein
MKYRVLLVVILMMLAGAGCAAPPPPLPVDELSHYFPLASGAYWVYQGQVQWTEDSTVKEDTVTWKMEVVEVVRRDHVVGYRLKGHPGDLAWYEPGQSPGDSVIIQVGPTRYYQSSPEALARLKDPDDFLLELVDESQLFLDAPLIPGELFGETGQTTRPDTSYCWVVTGVQPAQLDNIPGVTGSIARSQYTLIFQSRPDQQTVEFVPGVGITRFAYSHHGTVAEADVKLIEYHAGTE